uniref:Uncharacterized protein n=1 Tax=Aegilops tauschii TaxID=37682 RepID=M8BQY0_AEGTA
MAASELQTSMIETMEATEIEKQRHHSTRMEALVRLAELEVTNAELAKSLAREQWNLEVQVDQVAHLREEVDLKTFAQDKYKRKIAKIQKTSAPLVDEIESLRRLKLEDEIIDAEYTQTCDRIVSLKDKARKIEENIELTRRDMVQPTEVEIELKKRLDQLTDRLIQKQMQVESLSSEKSTLVLRMEAVSRSLDTNASSLASSSSSSRIDIEAGTWQESYPPYSSPRLRDRIRTGQQHLGYAIRQLDSIFSAGHIFLRRNPKAQVGAAVYLAKSPDGWLYQLRYEQPEWFDPTDQERIEHLNAKMYKIGTRKHRKILTERRVTIMFHKTDNSLPLNANERCTGWRKIWVLCVGSDDKQDDTKWGDALVQPRRRRGREEGNSLVLVPTKWLVICKIF